MPGGSTEAWYQRAADTKHLIELGFFVRNYWRANPCGFGIDKRLLISQQGPGGSAVDY
jgi:hypothetical protein